MTNASERQALLAQIPDHLIHDFDRYLQRRLQQALSDAGRGSSISFDPDEVERDLMVQLFRETDGRVDVDQLGLVPQGMNEFWVETPDVDPRTLIPAGKRGKGKGSKATASQTSVSELGGGRLAIGAIALLACLIWFGWSLFRFISPASTVAEVQTNAPQTTVQVPSDLAQVPDQKDIAFFQPISLELPKERVYRVVAQTVATGNAWEPAQEAGIASWLNNTYVNSVVCLPADQQATLTALEPGETLTMRLANSTSRRYTVLRHREVERQETEVLSQNRAGLTLIACGSAGRTRTVVEASFTPPSLAQQVARVGQTQQLGEDVQVQLINVTQAPAAGLPDQMRVTLTATVYAPQEELLVLLATQFMVNGEPGLLLTTNHPPLSGGSTKVTWEYMVPRSAGDATWDVIAPSGEQVRYQLALTPVAPPVALTLDQGGITEVITGTTRTVSVPWIVQASTPLQLTADTLPLTATTERGPVATRVDIYPFVVPNTESRLTTRFVVERPIREIVVTSGDRQWRLTLP